MKADQSAQDVIYLVSCAVRELVPAASRVAAMDLDAVYAFAARHMLSAAVAFALERAGVSDGRSRNAIATAQRRAILFQTALEQVKLGLEQAGIWYLPLKGIVLKDLYPGFGMREFADFDILFDAERADAVKEIMEGLGFQVKRYGPGIHDCYSKPPVLNFEMHRELFGASRETFRAYYRDVQNRLVGEGLEKRFAPEDLYLYLLAHMYKHYSVRGTGLRSLLDLYVFLTHERLDLDYVAAEAEMLGLGEFEARLRTLALHVFSGDALRDEEREMLGYFVDSGTYGTAVHRLENAMRASRRGRFGYLLHRFLVPVRKTNGNYAKFAKAYPLFYRHRVLLPFLPCYRCLRALRNGKLRTEGKALWLARVHGGVDTGPF